MANGDPHAGYVFVSYASADRARVFGIAGVLEAQGIHLWLDRRSITGGRRWTTEIVRGVEECAVLLVMCSPASVASRNVQQEVQLAWESGRPMLPVIVEEVQLPAELRYALAGQQWVEVRDRPEREWLAELVGALGALGVKTPQPAPDAPVDARDSLLPGKRGPTGEPRVQVTRLHNLPSPRSSFVGRETELEVLLQFLREGRSVTITGSAGVGKSRLALEIGWRTLTEFPDGVFLVSLDAAENSSDVEQRVAAALDLPEQTGRTLIRQIADRMASRHVLLILDNCERVIGPCANLLDALTYGGREVQILATSREVFGLAGETVFALDPLKLPESAARRSIAALQSCEAVQLFIDRARAAYPKFELTTENAPVVADICSFLDGVPLAIELAAVRIRVLTPAELRARLTDTPSLPRASDHSGHSRLRTVQAALDWSYDTLTEPERVLWRRLSVFAESYCLPAAEVVCGREPLTDVDVLDLLTRLVDKSLVLVLRGAAQTRYRLLRTLQQYAVLRLRESGEEADLLDRHARWCREVVQRGETTELRAEYPNIRAAVDRLLATGHNGQEVLELVGNAAMRFLLVDAYPGEGRRIVRRLLEQGPFDRTASLGWALSAKGRFEVESQVCPDTESTLQNALGIGREIDDWPLVMECLNTLGLLRLLQAKEQCAQQLLSEAVELGNGRGLDVRRYQSNLGLAYMQAGNFEKARQAFEAVLIGRTEGGGFTYFHLGWMALLEDNAEESARLARIGLDVAETSGLARARTYGLVCLGAALIHLGHVEEGVKLFRESLRTQRERGLGWNTHRLVYLAWYAHSQGDVRRAVTLLTYVRLRYTTLMASGWWWPFHPSYSPEAILSKAEQELDAAEIRRCMEIAATMSLDDAIACALEEPDECNGPPGGARHAR